MHIALKKIRYDLMRYLPRGSEEQVEDIYNIAKEAYYETEKGKDELKKLEKLKVKQNSIKVENKATKIVAEKINRVADKSETLENK